MTEKMPRDLSRYEKFLRLAADDATTAAEQRVALDRVRKMEEEDPKIRIRYAEWKAREESAKRNAGNPQASQDPFGDFISAQLDGLFGAARGATAESVQQVAAAVVAGVEDLLGTAKTAIQILTEGDIMSVLNDLELDDYDLGTINWDKDVTTAEHVANAYDDLVRIDEDDFMVIEGDDKEEGDLAQVAVQVPLGLLIRCSKEPHLAQEFLAQLTLDILTEDDEDDDDGEGEEAPAGRFGRRAG